MERTMTAVVSGAGADQVRAGDQPPDREGARPFDPGQACDRVRRIYSQSPTAALALDRKKLAAFSALGGGFLRFPIGDRRCNRTRASVGNAGGNARPSLTNATLAASRLLHRRSPTAPCSKGALTAHRKSWPHFRPSAGTAAPSVAPARHNFANDLAVRIGDTHF